MKEYKGYYLPPSMAEMEKTLALEERIVDDARILVPKATPGQMKAVVAKLRENRSNASKMSTEDIAAIYDKVSKKWKNNDYAKKQAALKYLPLLTNLSPELIEYFQFRSIYKIDGKTISFLSSLKLNEDIFKDFVKIEYTGTYLRCYAGLFDKLKLKQIANAPRDITLVTYITPANVPGFIESLGILLGNIVKASVLVKTPTSQPLFAPLFAESVAEESPALGETIAVMPWRGGDAAIEEPIFKASDAVSVVSSSETAVAVKEKVERLNKGGQKIKGCYHGGKFGLDLVAREFANEDVAGLTAIDGIGYEGYMCASPAFGFFVEKGGKLTPEQYAERMAEEAGRLSKAIPQTAVFRKLREKKVAEALASMQDGQKVFTTPEHDYAVVYSPKPALKPIGQDRFFRVMPLERLEDIVPMLKPWKEFLQTAGVAIPQDRILTMADKLGRAGISNLRIAGTVPLPRLGEAWDGYFPVYEFFIPDTMWWVSINGADIRKEIDVLVRSKEELIAHGAFNMNM